MHTGKMLLTALMLLMLACAPSAAPAQTRALLVACSEFTSKPDLGNASSGNLHLLGSALVGADPRLAVLSFEDGTIGTAQALGAAIDAAFADAAESDLSILYLCTHGVLSSADDGQVYLLLGDGSRETPLHARQLFSLVSHVQGEKLLIIDACYSGALIGREAPVSTIRLPGAIDAGAALPTSLDPSIHVLTSASGAESSWYFDSDGLSTGAISYFASALASGLGLYGAPEADADGDGRVTLAEMQRYLGVAVPSSTAQLLSSCPERIELPVTGGAMLSRPLTGFSYGSSLLTTDDPTLEFSFTAAQETSVQYRLVEYDAGRWNWDEAQTFLDEGDDGSGLLTPGRKQRALTLSSAAEGDSGYLMLQVFSVQDGSLILCSERLIGVQPAASGEALTVSAPAAFRPGDSELAVSVTLAVPAELTVSVFDTDGALVRRLAASQLTHPGDGTARLYWDGRAADGSTVPAGAYTIAAEAIIGGQRRKAACNVTVTD